jgi:hypothetical protein
MARKKKIVFADLIDAYFIAQHCRDCRAETQAYYQKRLAVLEKAFNFRLADREPPQFGRSPSRGRGRLPAAHPADDRNQARHLARRCLERDDHVGNPFWIRMEGYPGPIEVELERRHEGKVNRALQEVGRAQSKVSKLLRGVVADAVTMIAPGIERKSFDQAALVS